MSQDCVLAVSMANSIVGYNRRNVDSTLLEIVVLIESSTNKVK